MSDHSDSPEDPVKLDPVPESAAPNSPVATSSTFMDGLLDRWPAIDRVLFPAFAVGCTVFSAITFYGYMHVQTRGEWSAPLDDVFIHFDYARAAARGFPFEWSEGNGFSSGNTSILYPFVLAIGYMAGFRSANLMAWAGLVAILSMTAFFVAVGRVLDPLSRAAKYIVPPAVLSMGALAWSLWSGMENAFHLGMWALMLFPTFELIKEAEAKDLRAVRRHAWVAGFAGVLLFLTRPESVVCIAAFALYAAACVRRSFGMRDAVLTVLRMGLPGAVALGLQSIANRAFTGEWTAAGAIVKLAINHPYMTSEGKFDQWLSLLGYVIRRNTDHHFADVSPWGWIVPVVALAPLFSKKTRGFAIILWAQIIGWSLLVALNGQVRWQNERYTMSAVAWLFVLAAMGLGVLMTPTSSANGTGRAAWGVRVAIACAVMGIYWHHQTPNMRDQIWFFGRASRNIRDQHIIAGKVLAERKPRRVLVGDAGALIYSSDRPGLDIIGLGGYHDLPFARAGVNGLGASLELIERIPDDDRPDYMALYPSWWGDLPPMFGRRLVGIPVVGNVICGGPEKVLYKADWSALNREGRPRSLHDGEGVVDELDVGDLVSEKAHQYNMPKPSMGFVVHRVLPEPGNGRHELFDAGRIIPGGEAERGTFVVPQRSGRLIVRVVPSKPIAADVHIDGKLVGRLTSPAAKTWNEVSLDLPAELPPKFTLSLTPVEGEWVTFHMWIVSMHGDTPAAPGG